MDAVHFVTIDEHMLTINMYLLTVVSMDNCGLEYVDLVATNEGCAGVRTKSTSALFLFRASLVYRYHIT